MVVIQHNSGLNLRPVALSGRYQAIEKTAVGHDSQEVYSDLLIFIIAIYDNIIRTSSSN